MHLGDRSISCQRLALFIHIDNIYKDYEEVIGSGRWSTGMGISLIYR